MAVNLPTEAEIQLNIMYALLMAEELDKTASKYSPNYLDMEQDLLNAAQQDYAPEMAQGAAQMRARYAAVLAAGTLRPVLDPMFRTYGRIIDSPATDVDTILADLYQYFIDNHYEVYSRNLSYGTVSSNTGTGSGSVFRLTVDENGYTLENTSPDTRKIECIADARSGAVKHEEIFRLAGIAPGRDLLDVSRGAGTGKQTNLQAISARTSLLRNASFSAYSGTAAVPTAISNWTAGTIGSLAVDTSNYYRDFNGDTTPAALQFSDNTYVEQVFSTTNLAFNPNRPYFLSVMYNREVGTGDGTLTLQMGNSTVSVALVAQTGWNMLMLPMTSDVWFKNFNNGTLSVKITLASNTTGTVLIDDVILSQMSEYDGCYYTIVGGATAFLKDDFFTVSDTDGVTTSDGLINKWLWRVYNRYLPSTTDISASSWEGDVAS